MTQLSAPEFVSIILGQHGEEAKEELLASLSERNRKLVKGNTKEDREQVTGILTGALHEMYKLNLNPMSIIEEAGVFLSSLVDAAQDALQLSPDQQEEKIKEMLRELEAMLEGGSATPAPEDYTQEMFLKELSDATSPNEIFDVMKKGHDAGHTTLQ